MQPEQAFSFPLFAVEITYFYATVGNSLQICWNLLSCRNEHFSAGCKI